MKSTIVKKTAIGYSRTEILSKWDPSPFWHRMHREFRPKFVRSPQGDGMEIEMAHLALAELSQSIKVERTSCTTSVTSPAMHYHVYYELYILISGRRRYFIGHKIYDVYPGNMVVVPRAEVHRTSPIGDGGFDRYVVYFDRSTAEDIISSIGEAGFNSFLESGCIALPQECSEKIFSELAEMKKEEEKGDRYSDAMMKNLLESIILHAMRHGSIKHCEEKEGADKIQEAAMFINKNYKSEITLKDVASFAYMEETYFSKKFKQLTGFGFKEYLTLIRLREAENLLRTTNLSVSDISDASGFSSSNYFGDIFKKENGLSPREYRRSLKNKD